MKFDLRYLKYKLLEERQSPIENREPWFNQKAVDWLKNEVKSDWVVLEYGGGGSTLYFSDNCKKVYTIEQDIEWKRTIMALLKKKNVEFVNTPPEKLFDCIIIDDGDRIKHFEEAKKLIKPTGLIIFDNFERYSLQDKPLYVFQDYAIQNAGITTTAVFV